MARNWLGIPDFVRKTGAWIAKPVPYTRPRAYLEGRYEVGDVSLIVYCLRPPELIKNDVVVGFIADDCIVFNVPVTPEQNQKFLDAWREWQFFRR